MRPIILALSLALFTGSALAGETPWQEVAPGVKLRLISSGQIKPIGPTLLPVELQAEPGAPSIELSAVLGICSDICLPAQAHFSLPLDDARPDRPNGLRIRQALATTPMAWTTDPQPLGDVELRRDAGMLAVTLVDPGLDPASLIAATDSGEPLFGTPQKSPEPNLVLIPILGKADELDLENRAVQLTFLTEMGAFEVKRTVKVPAAD